MTRHIFALFAALTLLVAVPVVAQQETTEPATDPGLEAYESRTNPNAGNITDESGLTLTGTVIEWNDEQLVLRTATGVQHIQIVTDTERPVELTAGESVSVDYTRTSSGVMIASTIRTQGTTTGTETATSDFAADAEPTDKSMDADLQAEAEVDASLDTEASYDAGTTSDLDAQADLDTETDLDTEADLDTTMDDQESLPATGSELPLVALLGLLSVAAAVGVRKFIR